MADTSSWSNFGFTRGVSVFYGFGDYNLLSRLLTNFVRFDGHHWRVVFRRFLHFRLGFLRNSNRVFALSYWAVSFLNGRKVNLKTLPMPMLSRDGCSTLHFKTGIQINYPKGQSLKNGTFSLPNRIVVIVMSDSKVKQQFCFTPINDKGSKM